MKLGIPASEPSLIRPSPSSKRADIKFCVDRFCGLKIPTILLLTIFRRLHVDLTSCGRIHFRDEGAETAPRRVASTRNLALTS